MSRQLPEDTTPDPTTGLSPRDKALIVGTWEAAYQADKRKHNAIQLLLQLVTTYPELLARFPRFKDETSDVLRGDPNFLRHSLNVYAGLMSYVDKLDDTPTLVHLIEQSTHSHFTKHGVGSEDMEKLRSMFTPYLRSILGDECTPEIEAAWDRLLAIHNTLFKKTVGEIQSNTTA